MANSFSIRQTIDDYVNNGQKTEFQNFNEDKINYRTYAGYAQKEQSADLLRMDIAQSKYFTVELAGGILGNYLNLDLPCESKESADFKLQCTQFLPVKSITIQDTNYDNMSIPMAVFSDIPLLSKKKTCTIQLTCYDKDDDRLEISLRRWKNQCFIGNRVVYMSEIYTTFKYRSYNVKGKLNYSVDYYVIPVGPLTISRDYESNNEKLITFNLATIGEAATNSSLYVGMGQQQEEY